MIERCFKQKTRTKIIIIENPVIWKVPFPFTQIHHEIKKNWTLKNVIIKYYV